VAALRQHGSVVGVSPYYRTVPVGGPDQDDYLNAVVLLDTTATPRELMSAVRAIERIRGRERRERWGPRTLDVDILLYGDQMVDEPDLTIPHPRMTERRFALAPLLDVWPDAALPDGKRLASFLDAVADQQVERLEPAPPVPRWAAPVLFLLVGLAAVLIWWIGDWLL
jgi:2-amino-4-hydroxy-6-hydroxymethyldihydropteridine diphosphokinase